MAIHTNHNSQPAPYTWEQVRVRIPDGYNQDGTDNFKYRAFVFSVLHYDDFNNLAPTAQAYVDPLDNRGAFSCTRGSEFDNSWYQRVAYLFADEDGAYPINLNSQGDPITSHNIGPTSDGPDNPATPNTNIDPTQALFLYPGTIGGMNVPGMPFSMWSPGMPMEHKYPEVGEIVKITDLQVDYRDAVWYNKTSPWEHILPDGNTGEFSSFNGSGTPQSPNPYQLWPAAAPKKDWICLQVIAIITETQFNSNDIFIPSQTQPLLDGPAFTGIANQHTCWNGGTEGCHYHDRADNNLTSSGFGGIGHITLYMKPNPTWSGLLNMGTENQEIGAQPAECYDVCAYKTAQDNTFPNIPATGWNSEVQRQWNPRLNDEGPPNLPWTWDCCNIHCPVERFREDNAQPCWTKGYRVPFDGRYIIKYEAEVYQSFGGGGGFWSDPSRWSAWVTIDRQMVTRGGNGAIYYSNPNTWCQDCGYGGGDSYLPTPAPFNASYTSAGTGNFNAYWDADDSNGVFKKDSLEFEINLVKGMEIQIVFLGINYDFDNTNTCRIRKQYFRVYPKPGLTLVNSVVTQNDAPPPDALCYGVPTTQTWYGHVQYGGTAHQNNDGILAEPGHDWDCKYCVSCLKGWSGTTTIFPKEGCRECLKVPSWNCDLSLSYLPVTIDPIEWWRISGQGCIDPGDGTGTYTSFSGNPSNGSFNFQPSCIDQCNIPWWECVVGSCIEHTTVAPINAYLTLASCQANCVVESWECDMTQGVCYDPGTGNGQYTTLANCNYNCHSTTWNCGNLVGGTPGVCYQSNGPSGQYTTLAACESNCFPDTWDCVKGSCVNPGDGTGVYTSLITCKSTCSDKEPCPVYITTQTGGIYKEPGWVTGDPVHNICAHDLWFYDITANTTTWVMTLPQQIGSTFPTPFACGYRGSVANTKTKLWTYKDFEPYGTTSFKGIIEYDIDPTDPTILTHSRDIDILPLLGPVTSFNHVNTTFLTAINNKTLIISKKDLAGTTSSHTMVISLDIHPVSGPVATDKFVIPFPYSQGDALFLPSESALFVSYEGDAIRKYDWISGALLSSFIAPEKLKGLFMNQGNIYTTGVHTQKKYLVDKQTCATTFISYVNTALPYTTGGIWQTTLNAVVPTNITLGGTISNTLPECTITNASSSPCCDNDQTNCGACLETLSQYMPSTGVNFIQYQPQLQQVYIGDCVSDPGGCCYCCTQPDVAIPIAPTNCSSRLYATTLSYVDGISKTNEKVTHLEEIKRWFANPVNKSQDTAWNTTYFAKRNNEYEKGLCLDDFEAISLFSLTISVSGESITFEDKSTWSDVIKHSISLGAGVDKSMTWEKYIKVMYSSFGVNKFSYSVSENSCGCYNGETSGPKAKVMNFPCSISSGEYVDISGQWRECEVDIHGDDCTGNTMNWGCCGGNMLSSNYLSSICDNRQGICPSGCAKISTGYVGYDTQSFFEWYAQVGNGFYATDIRDVKYILNNFPNQASYPCYETGVGWWYNFQDKFGIAWTSTTGVVSSHFQNVGTTYFSTWLEFVTVLFSNNFSTLNLGLTFNQLLNYQYQPLINKLLLIQPGFALHIYGSPCKCDGVECVQNVPKPDGYLTKDDCQSSYLINDCPHSDQRCTPDPWRCVKRQVPILSGPGGISVNYKCFCVQDGGGSYITPTYATKELCEEAKNCCLPETYNCKSSESDCVGKKLLPHIVGRWWDGEQATNKITSTPIATNTELFANPIFGYQSSDIRIFRWECSLIPANTISSHNCIPTSQLASSWAVGNTRNTPQVPWIVVTGLEFKDPYETNNINNSLGLPGLPVYTWLDYIGLLNSYMPGIQITPSMSSGQVGSAIQNYMGWGGITHGISWRRCECNPHTTNCSCVDPGDGSGVYRTLENCTTKSTSCCGQLYSEPTVTQRLGSSNVVQFPIADISTGVKEAKEKGYKGDEKEVLDIYAKLSNYDGTPNVDKGFLKCKKCGGGFGICGKKACIGLAGLDPPEIIITINF